jgi:D-sedoheptulose 7-phosphate isomerase
MSHTVGVRMVPADDRLVEGVAEELRQSAATMVALADEAAAKVAEAARVLIEALSSGNGVWLCGNGGSAAQAQHLAAELLGRFERIRRPLAASALSADTAVVTALGNDFGFDEIFARQLHALARPGDVLIALSTSGDSANVVAAAARARQIGCRVVALTGPEGGAVAELADVAVQVPARRVSRIQEGHLAVGHVICRLVERGLA